MAVRAEQRLWRTSDGRLVVEGDPDSATLAYVTGDDIAPADQAKVPGRNTERAEPPKAQQPPANKARGRTADK